MFTLCGSSKKILGTERPVCSMLAVCCILILCCPVLEAADWTFRVSYVPDGDTLFLETGEKIRIKGIDCPEMGHDGHKNQYYAKEARNYLWQLVQKQKLRADTKSVKADRFARLLAQVYLPDGRSLGRILVENGYAFYYPHGKGLSKEDAALLKLQQQAMNGQHGMWARILRMPAALSRYVGNAHSRRFHTLSCRYGKKMKRKNRVEFSDIRQAFYAGFAPCRACTPWPHER